MGVLQSLQNQKTNSVDWGHIGGNKGGGKGGKSWGKYDSSWARYADPNLKVWIGGFAEGNLSKKETNQALKEHMGEGCKYAEIGKKGTGFALYATEDQVRDAVATLNGS